MTIGAHRSPKYSFFFYFKEFHSHKSILGRWAPMELTGSEMEQKWHMALVILVPLAFPKHPFFSLTLPHSPARPLPTASENPIRVAQLRSWT